MRVGERIAARRRELGLSQTKLAREAGLSQGTIGKLEAGLSSGSSHLHRIAAALNTTAAYLTGDTDDPDLGALPKPPAVAWVMLPVALPSERALARMFEGLLRVMPPEADLAEQARLLAKRLPIGLSQLRDLLPEVGAGGSPMERELAEALSTPGLEPRP